MTHSVLAYYRFTHIDNPHDEVAKHKVFFEGKDVTCRIYISEEGINGQLCATEADAQKYIDWMHADPRFVGLEFKIHAYHTQAFPRMTVKYRSQIVALDAKVDISLAGEHVSPEDWKKMLENKDEDTILLDVRNDYEWELGHFEGAELPKLDQFREFPQYAKDLAKERDPKKTKVMMYCTGGIRCELYSALMKQEGFEQVYQLDGGVIKYGLQKGSEHWKGRLFVFDDRLSVPLNEKDPGEIISHCVHCGALSDLYYNCANVDCNELFISCHACAVKLQGCCSAECQAAPRVRAFENAERPRPYRRLNA
ncbi:MAG: rhodanese-related sulfurtransferase [Verrucomicrobia bacterium]|nr:rhodanese-related sulfurtransferase [Verrucomicrobiota bacterium]